MTGNGAAARAQVKGGLHTHARAREQGAEVAGKAELGRAAGRAAAEREVKSLPWKN